jgi:hypothetical protein
MDGPGETDGAGPDESHSPYDQDDLGILTLFAYVPPACPSNDKVKPLEQWVEKQLATNWGQVFDRGFIQARLPDRFMLVMVNCV